MAQKATLNEWIREKICREPYFSKDFSEVGKNEKKYPIRISIPYLPGGQIPKVRQAAFAAGQHILRVPAREHEGRGP